MDNTSQHLEPQIVQLELTNFCNLKCTMCHYRFQECTQKQYLDIACFEHLTDLHNKLFVIGCRFEPTIHPNIYEILQKISDMGNDIEIVTNATLLHNLLKHSLQDIRFKNVYISFDGITKETFETIRVNAHYKKTLDNILRFKEAVTKDACFVINYTAMRSNIEELPQAVDFWERYDFDALNVISMVLRYEDQSLADELLNTPERMTLFQQALRESATNIYMNNYRIVLISPLLSSVFSQNTDNRPTSKTISDIVAISQHPKARVPSFMRSELLRVPAQGLSIDCSSFADYVDIDWEGNVSICMQFNIGNIHDSHLSKIWNSHYAQRIRNLIKQTPRICENCELYKNVIDFMNIDYSDQSIHTVKPLQGIFLAPHLVQSHGIFNIVSWLGGYYAIPQSYGPLDLLVDDVTGIEDVFISDSFDRLIEHIDHFLSSYQYPDPALIKDDGSYRILAWKGKYYGVPHALENINLRRDIHSTILVFNTLQDLEDSIGSTAA